MRNDGKKNSYFNSVHFCALFSKKIFYSLFLTKKFIVTFQLIGKRVIRASRMKDKLFLIYVFVFLYDL